ncbi:MAG: hypothetical protein RL660_2591 [Bacteroidota bacterium]|jgi:hypothetical protein
MRSAIWVTGGAAKTLDFRQAPVAVDTIRWNESPPIYPDANLWMGHSNICDTSGNLLFFCKSFAPFTKDGFAMQGWQDVGAPYGTKYNALNQRTRTQRSIILPKQGNTYYLISAGMSDANYDQWRASGGLWATWWFDVLTYTVIDMDSNDGKGAISSKNNIMLQDRRMAIDRMTATRHGNGRDWWIVRPHKTEQKYYTFLATQYTIVLMDSVLQNYDSITYLGGRAQCSFSPSGQHFCMVHDDADTFRNDIFTYDFDRCNGNFSNYHKYHIPLSDTFDSVTGCCYSPDSKLLYVSSYYEVFQLQVGDTNASSIQFIHGPDSTWGFPYYLNMQLANNGSIYIGNAAGIRQNMSLISNPNQRGPACNFVPQGFRQNIDNITMPPNMPNYGLGRWLNSPCDTIPPPKPPTPVPSAWQLYPNPATDLLYIDVPDSSAASLEVRIANASGQIVSTGNFAVSAQHRAELNIGMLAAGFYHVLVTHQQQKFSGKLIVMR